jgi:hypothetical protein
MNATAPITQSIAVRRDTPSTDVIYLTPVRRVCSLATDMEHEFITIVSAEEASLERAREAWKAHGDIHVLPGFGRVAPIRWERWAVAKVRCCQNFAPTSPVILLRNLVMALTSSHF